MKKDNKGRPTVITEEVIRKLEEAFTYGCTDLEACLMADIGKTALYDYQQNNPAFTERKELLKHNPVMLARKTVVDGLEEDPEFALKFLERKAKKEFSTRMENQALDKDGQPADNSLKVEFVSSNTKGK